MTTNHPEGLRPCLEYPEFKGENCESMKTLYPCDNCVKNMIDECNKNMTLWERFREWLSYMKFKLTYRTPTEKSES